MMRPVITIIPYTLQFKRPAGTSRGVYHNHPVWYVVVRDPKTERFGVGECAPLFDLSCDYTPTYAEHLKSFSEAWEQGRLDWNSLRDYPSILFGFEMALRHIESGGFTLSKTSFAEGKQGIPINGLIWMGDYRYMFEQIEEKIEAGFRCVKLKIGAIDFEEELSLLQRIRQDFTADTIELRVDANGGFTKEEALGKLKRLAELDIHSIEQPIPAGQWEEMAALVAQSPLPIALDEELIGVNNPQKKRQLLETIRPHYIILKPTLHGGISGCEEWIALAEELSVGWWATSALESNIGLNAIAHWVASFNNPLPQGLGTGMLYTNNLTMPLAIKGDELWFDPKGKFVDWKTLL